MKRFLFPLAFIVGIAAAALSGAHTVAHPLASMHIDSMHIDSMHID